MYGHLWIKNLLIWVRPIKKINYENFFTYLKVAALVASLALSVKYCSFKDTPSTLRSAIPQDTVFVHDTIHWFNTVYDTIYKTKYYQNGILTVQM